MKKNIIHLSIYHILLCLSLCFLFFACGGSGDDGGDEPIPTPTTKAQQDSLALIKINTGTVKWNQVSNMDSWQGVRTDIVNGERRVVYLDLHNSQLTGKIPTELNELTALEYLDLSQNNLSDNIPNLSVISSLQILDLHDNKLSGTLSDNITKLKNLTYLSLGGNLFYSEIPAGINTLSKLRVLDFSNQKKSLSEPGFSGNIPTSWSSLDKLQYLYLHKNTFTGTIPTFLTSLSGLVSLTLDDNSLSGQIPEGLGNIGSLENISMKNNILTGKVPLDLLLNPNWERWKDQIITQNGSNLEVNGSVSAFNSLKATMDIEYQLPDKQLFYRIK